MEFLAIGYGDGIWPRCLEKGIGQASGRNVLHRLQAVVSMCNLLVLEIGYLCITSFKGVAERGKHLFKGKAHVCLYLQESKL